MAQTKFDGQRRINNRINNGNRFGGDKAWKQHRDDGDYSNVVGRNAVSQRFARQEMVAEAQCPDDNDYSGDPLGLRDCEFPVYLRFDGAGRLIAAHCG